MGAEDLAKFRSKPEGRQTAKTTLYPESPTWDQTWAQLKAAGYIPQSIYKDALVKAEAEWRERLRNDLAKK